MCLGWTVTFVDLYEFGFTVVPVVGYAPLVGCCS